MSSRHLNQPWKTADAVVVGGGIIGLAVTRSLILHGVGKVLLIERGSLGCEASWAAAGMLAPQAEADCADDFFHLACKSRDMYPEFAATLLEETGIDVELDLTGTLYVALNQNDEEELERRFAWQTRAGLPVEKLAVHDLRVLEPCISEKVRAALRFPRDVQVENRRVVNALAESNRGLGAGLITGTTVELIHIERSKIQGVQTSRGFVSTERLVIAGGAWTSFLKIADQATPDLRIEPIRGQMICFQSSPRVARHVICSPRGYLVPRTDGRLLAGSTAESAGFDKRVTVAGMHSILTTALEISPDIATLSVIDSWGGLRPRAQDNLPVLGPYAEIEGLFYATGHYRNGILLAPITGELIAGVVAGHRASPLLDAFAPGRFDPVSVN